MSEEKPKTQAETAAEDVASADVETEPTEPRDGVDPVEAEAVEITIDDPDEPAASTESVEAQAESEEPDELETARAEAGEYKDRWMRSAAELDNYRRRVARDYEQQIARSGERILSAVIGPLDNLARGIETARKAEDGPDLEGFIGGMELVYGQFMAALEREQVRVMEPVGEQFDPNQHEALVAVENADSPPNIVLEVVERGYWIGDRVLRHAKVVVSKSASEDDAPRDGASEDEAVSEEE